MSSFKYLLDTNIISDLIKHPSGSVSEKLKQLDPSFICTNTIVACELRFGAEKRGVVSLALRVEQLLDHLEILPLGGEIDRFYAELRTYLERTGTPIGPNDMFIAAHALALGLTVVTGNLKEFSRVPGLTVENWLVESI